MNAETQQAIFEQLKALVQANITDDFAVEEAPGRLEVNTKKEVMVNGRKHLNMNLLSVIIQKQHVGFYFMPVYIEEGIRASLSPELNKMLKGKSCFHCKAPLTSEYESEIAALIRLGVELYERKRWVASNQ